MPVVVEVGNGAQFSRNTSGGQLADTCTRVFKVLLDAPGAFIDIQSTCSVFIGDVHPSNSNIFCSAFDARYDGDSQVVVFCTFTYSSTPAASGTDRNEQAPDVRPANWSVSTSLSEVPAMLWKPIGNATLGTSWQVPANTVGDRYDGVVRVEPLVTFSIDQYVTSDPSSNVLLAGCVNSGNFKIGAFTAPARTLMFRGVQCQPVVETWGPNIFRGWKATYEFVYKSNYAGSTLGNIGWDIAVPQTGFNVKAFNPLDIAGSSDPYGQPLKHKSGKIDSPLALPDTITADQKVRAMVLVFEYENGGASQLPSAQPIPINDNGRPRTDTASPKVLVYRYQVQDEIDFSQFGLRLT